MNKKAFAVLVVALALPMVSSFEGLRKSPYYDIVGVRTVCYGETRGVENRVYTKAECDNMLSGGLKDFYTAMDPCLPDDLPARSTAMFLSLGYNVGTNAVCRSNTIQRAFAKKDYRTACNAINLFNRAGGKVIPGLVKRRGIEAEQCLEGLMDES